MGRIVSLVDFLFVIYCSVLLSGLPGKGWARGEGAWLVGFESTRVRMFLVWCVTVGLFGSRAGKCDRTGNETRGFIYLWLR